MDDAHELQTRRTLQETGPGQSSQRRLGTLVVAVVLTWNDTEMAAGCIQSVLDNDYPAIVQFPDG